jgi:hypothetical protein
VDGFFAIQYFQHIALETFAVTMLTNHHQVGHKLHFDSFHPFALTSLATSTVGIE